MSALPARLPASSPRGHGAGSTAPTRGTSGPRLRAVRSPVPARSLAPYLLLCASILLGSLVTALMLNTHMAVTAHEVLDATRSLNLLTESEASLRQEVEQVSSPVELERRATELGMERAEQIGYIDLAASRLLGSDAGADE